MSQSPNTSTWDERYATDDYYFGQEPNDFLRAHADAIRPGGTVLCLAEGEGRNAVHLARCGFQVTAIDQSPVGLAKASALAARHGVIVQTVVADLASWRIDARRWDGIVSIWCHLPAVLRREVHRQVLAALVPGGVFLLEAYRPEQLQFGTGGPPSAESMPTLRDLQQELHGLTWLLAVERQRFVHEGRGHHGPSAVVQAIARKPLAAG